MASLLHVQASTRGDRSYSLRAAKAFLESYAASHPGDSVKTLDLWNVAVPEFDALAASAKYRIMHGEDHSPEEALAWEVVAGAVEGFKSADKIVISSPMWNFGIPYRLKQYLDVIVQPGLTFSFSPDAGYSGLVTGRPAMLILARGGEYPAGSEAAAFDFQRPYLETVLRFIGFSDIKAVVVEPTIQAGPEAADKRLAAAVENARKMADSF